MTKLNLIFALITLAIVGVLYIWTIVKNAKERKALKDKIKYLESRVFMKEMPEYIKHYDNRYPSVYKIIDIRVLPQNPVTMPELCAVITGKAKDGRTLNATVDKFIEATKKEYNAGKRDELNF